MKVYAGAPGAARRYVECDRGRADDYYLTEGPRVARRFTVTEGRVTERAPLSGQAYESWVAGCDPVTGEPRGQLRADARAVRFVEVVVNGPKSWSLAAALHPGIAQAYEAAQDRAAAQILEWLSVHATTRVGPRGGQMPVSLEVLEAVTVRHYTSRARDPHWHLHLQVNARVFAAGKWRGLWTVDVRDSLAAFNGIGHAAMATDPHFAAALAAHGYTTDADGEIGQLAGYVGPMSARHAQIARNADRYEREWVAAHPGETPGPVLRRAWDARAWAEHRPDKVTPAPGADLRDRWRAELHELGFRAPARPVRLVPTSVGALDREALVERALARLAAGRSAWNAADVRGKVERLIAAAAVVCEPAIRVELAEDLTARALDRCAPLLDREGVPEHIRVWTSPVVLAVETDLADRLGARAAAPDSDSGPSVGADLLSGLDAGQEDAVAALAGDRALVVVEGAAGAGKTAVLAATRRALENRGRGLVVVTPTLKAAKVARAEVGAAAGSAGRLAYDYGWRWSDDGVWTRGASDEPEPARRRLCQGDLLVVDEAGMLDQDTARALLTIADEAGARVALLGDRHQLAAVGRGGVLDFAAECVDPAAYVALTGLHRFTRADQAGRTVPDIAYADLTLAMRAGTDPGAVFDALLARGQLRLHPDEAALRAELAEVAAASVAAGERIAVVVDTREQATELNAAIRDRLVADGRVDDRRAIVTGAGEWIGAGDRIVTRRNDAGLDVANRDTWIVEAVGRTGTLLVTPADDQRVDGQRLLPAAYVTHHVELGYATTAHGAQGDTVLAAHLVIGEHTGAASAYVGMTRGRQQNIAHLVAEDVADAREQWIAAFARDRADLGPAHAARLAAAEAAHYAPGRPLEQVLAELRETWTAEAACLTRLDALRAQQAALDDAARTRAGHAARLAALHQQLQDRCTETEAAARQAQQRAAVSGAALTADAGSRQHALLAAWDRDRPAAAAAAQAVLAGPGPLRLRRAAVARAGEQLTAWGDRWRTWLPALPTDPTALVWLAAAPDDRTALSAALATAVARAAALAHPEHAALTAAAQAAARQHEDAREELARAVRVAPPAADDSLADEVARRTAAIDGRLATARQELTELRDRLATLAIAPALRAQPGDRLTAERAAWTADRQAAADRRRDPRPTARAERPSPPPEAGVSLTRNRVRDTGPSFSR